MTILHVCGVENKMSNGATVAVLNHVNEQAKTGLAEIWALHINDVQLNWNELVHSVLMDDYEDAVSHVDLIVFHEIYYMPFFKMASYATKVGKPYVVIPHGGLTKGAQSQKKYAKILVNSFWAKKFIVNAAGVQFLSEKELSVSLNYNKNPFILPNGITIPSRYKTSFLFDKKLNLVYIGRINMYYKGLDLLCQAVSTSESIKEKFHFTLYGPLNCEDAPLLRDLIKKLDLKDTIELKEPVYLKDKEKALLKADGFIQLSRSEAFGLSIAEAMSYGVPVVITPGTTFADFVSQNDCGWITDGSEKDIIGTLERVYNEKNLFDVKSKNARDSVRKKYEWSIVAKEIIENYSRISKGDNINA